MCFKKKFEFIRHYTNVGALFNILDNGIRFSKPNPNWDDQNDFFTLEKYKQHLNETGGKKEVFLICFCGDLGNVHHWYYYGSSNSNTMYENCYENIKCNIKLNKSKFDELLKRQNPSLRLKPLHYVLSSSSATTKPEKGTMTLEEYLTDWDKLLYVKRREYYVEQEWRVVAVAEQQPPSIDIKECIEAITILIDEDSFIFSHIKEMIACKYPNLKYKVLNSGVHKSKTWEIEINKIIKEKLK